MSGPPTSTPAQYAGPGAVLTELRYAEDVTAGTRLRWWFDDPNPARTRDDGTCAACGAARADGFAGLLYRSIPETVRVEETVLVRDARTYDAFGIVSLVLVREDGTELGAQFHVFHLLRCVPDVPS